MPSGTIRVAPSSYPAARSSSTARNPDVSGLSPRELRFDTVMTTADDPGPRMCNFFRHTFTVIQAIGWKLARRGFVRRPEGLSPRITEEFIVSIAVRHAETTWEGSLAEGSGTIVGTTSGALDALSR